MKLVPFATEKVARIVVKMVLQPVQFFWRGVLW